MKTNQSSSAMVVLMCLGLGLIGCGGGSGSGDGSVKLLESELGDTANWTVYETFDQLEAAASVAAASDPTLERAANREKIVTYTANGLIAEIFEYLAVNGDGIAMGSRTYGVSVLKFDDLHAPRGKVYNYRKTNLEGIAEDQNQFYAWFWDGSIVDIASGEVVYGDAPQGTRQIFSAVPKNRFVMDSGDFYIGTSNLEADGSETPDMDNGLWKIDAALSTQSILIDQPVWCVYKDSTGAIWAGTKGGIYRQNGAVFENKHPGYAEQVFEFDGEIYALIKNFFHYPEADNDFDLYRWDGDEFQKICEVSQALGNPAVSEMFAFEWDGTLYISVLGSQDSLLVFDGDAFSLQANPIYYDNIGQQSAQIADGKLFTVGNSTGLNIWDGEAYFQWNAVNTAEGLISNAIGVLYVASDGRLWIGPKTSGFNILDGEGNFEITEVSEEYTIAGFFEKDGTAYVQGAAALYEAGNTGAEFYKSFSCNGERVYYDAVHGRLWAFPNFGSGNGALGMLDMGTLKVWGTTGFDNADDYWQRDYEWDKPAYHFNDVVAIPDGDAVFIALENGGGRVIRYDYQTDEFAEMDIPIESIRKFTATATAVFGVGPGSLVKYEGGSWAVVNGNLSGEAAVGLVVKHNYAFIAHRKSLEVVHLISGKTSVWNFEELPIKGEIQTIAMGTKGSQDMLSPAYAIYFGTDNGLVICDMNLL